MLEKYKAFTKKAKEVITGIAKIIGFTKLGTVWRDSFNWLGNLSSEEDNAKNTSEWVNRDISKIKSIQGQTQLLSGLSTWPFQLYAYVAWPVWWIVSRPKWLLKKLPFLMRSFANIYSHDHRKWLGVILPLFLFLLAASLYITSPIAAIIFAVLAVLSIPKINQLAAVIFEFIAHILIGALSFVGAVLKTLCMSPELIARTLFYFFKATLSPISSWKVKLPVALFLAGGIVALHFFAPLGITWIASSSLFVLKGFFITLMMWPMRKMMGMMHASHGASVGFHYIAWPFTAGFHILPYGIAGILSTVALTVFAAAIVFALVGIGTKLGLKAFTFFNDRRSTQHREEIESLLDVKNGIQSKINSLPDSQGKAQYNGELAALLQEYQDTDSASLNLKKLKNDLKSLNDSVDQTIREPNSTPARRIPPYVPKTPNQLPSKAERPASPSVSPISDAPSRYATIDTTGNPADIGAGGPVL